MVDREKEPKNNNITQKLPSATEIKPKYRPSTRSDTVYTSSTKITQKLPSPTKVEPKY